MRSSSQHPLGGGVECRLTHTLHQEDSNQLKATTVIYSSTASSASGGLGLLLCSPRLESEGRV